MFPLIAWITVDGMASRRSICMSLFNGLNCGALLVFFDRVFLTLTFSSYMPGLRPARFSLLALASLRNFRLLPLEDIQTNFVIDPFLWQKGTTAAYSDYTRGKATPTMRRSSGRKTVYRSSGIPDTPAKSRQIAFGLTTLSQSRVMGQNAVSWEFESQSLVRDAG